MATTFFYVFHHQNYRKRYRVDAKTPVFNRGVTYQTKEKGFIKVSIKICWGGVCQWNNIWTSGLSIAFIFLNAVREEVMAKQLLMVNPS
jgi:hypothetical protein